MGDHWRMLGTGAFARTVNFKARGRWEQTLEAYAARGERQSSRRSQVTFGFPARPPCDREAVTVVRVRVAGPAVFDLTSKVRRKVRLSKVAFAGARPALSQHQRQQEIDNRRQPEGARARRHRLEGCSDEVARGGSGRRQARTHTRTSCLRALV